MSKNSTNEQARTVIEKEFVILEVDKVSKNPRAYPKQLVQKWINDPRMKEGGYDVEYAIEDKDFQYDFLEDNRICGNVFELHLDGSKLVCKVKFKIDGEYADLIYGTEGKPGIIDNIAIVPKGKGAIKNQIIQDDYELYGFNLILLEESPFTEHEELQETTSK